MKQKILLCNLFITKSNVSNQNKKASMLLLSKEASNKDEQLKTRMLVTFEDDDSKNSENL